MTHGPSARPGPAPAQAAPAQVPPATAVPARHGGPRPGRHRAVAPRAARGPARGSAGTRPRRSLALAGAVLSGLGVIAVSGQASAADRPADSRTVAPATPSEATVPAILQPPAGAVRVATYRVVAGVQTYTCGQGAWTFKAPTALLVHTARRARAIYHFAGPTWQSLRDGSSVTAGKLAESPVAGAIPQLLLGVKTHSGAADGELADIAFIQRLNTRGGLAPTGPCTDGTEKSVRYGADYVLFSAS